MTERQFFYFCLPFSFFQFTLWTKNVELIASHVLSLLCQLSNIHVFNPRHFNVTLHHIDVLLFNSIQLSRCLVQLFLPSLSAATYQYATETASSEQVFLLMLVRSWLERETLQRWVAKMVSFFHTPPPHSSSLAFSIWSSICNPSSIHYCIIHQQLRQTVSVLSLVMQT